jgi:hypothetical protein
VVVGLLALTAMGQQPPPASRAVAQAVRAARVERAIVTQLRAAQEWWPVLVPR